MNRRDLMKRIVGVSALAGIEAPVQASTVANDAKPALAVLECNHTISNEMAQRLVAMWNENLEDTAFAGLKLLVLGEGMKLTFLDAKGRILNERLDAQEIGQAILDAPLRRPEPDLRHIGSLKEG